MMQPRGDRRVGRGRPRRGTLVATLDCPAMRLPLLPRAFALPVAFALLAACSDRASSRPADTSAPGASSTTVMVDTTPPLDAPDFAEVTINSVAFEGSYACDEGIAPQIVLTDDGAERAFLAYMDQRLFTSGTWSWDGTALRIESSAGTYVFTEVELGDGTMVLGKGEDRWVCRNVPGE